METADKGSDTKIDVEDIAIALIIEGKNIRPIVDDAVVNIAASIKVRGLLQPIIVRKIGEHYEIVAGHHRFLACKQLNHTKIAASVIVVADDDDAELMGIDENLRRNSLSAAEEAFALGRSKQIYDKRHSGAAQYVKGGKARQGTATEDDKAFATATAEALGMSERTVRRATLRFRHISMDVLKQVRRTVLDKGVELNAMALLKPEALASLLDRLARGESVSARHDLAKVPGAAKSLTQKSEPTANVVQQAEPVDLDHFGEDSIDNAEPATSDSAAAAPTQSGKAEDTDVLFQVGSVAGEALTTERDGTDVQVAAAIESIVPSKRGAAAAPTSHLGAAHSAEVANTLVPAAESWTAAASAGVVPGEAEQHALSTATAGSVLPTELQNEILNELRLAARSRLQEISVGADDNEQSIIAEVSEQVENLHIFRSKEFLKETGRLLAERRLTAIWEEISEAIRDEWLLETEAVTPASFPKADGVVAA